MSYSTPHFSRVRAFTLIEILVVIGMLALLSTIVLVAVNPLRQFAAARNAERQNDVAAILNATSERIADNGGLFLPVTPRPGDTCTTSIPSDQPHIIRKAQLDMRPCLVPTYLTELPHDPSTGSNSCNTSSCNGAGETYDTGYTIFQDTSTNRVTVCAPGAAESAIPGSVAFCLSR